MNAVTAVGRTLVDVGRPGLERRGADLEQQADREQRDAGEQQAVVGRAGPDRLVDARERHRARVAVDQGGAVQEEAGGEGAEQEVLERGLLAQQPAAPGQPAEQVERQREHLERDEHREQVTRRREHQHAADREQQQRVDLGVVEPLGGGQPLRLGAGQRRGLAREARTARPRAGARRTARCRGCRRRGSGPTGRRSDRRR